MAYRCKESSQKKKHNWINIGLWWKCKISDKWAGLGGENYTEWGCPATEKQTRCVLSGMCIHVTNFICVCTCCGVPVEVRELESIHWNWWCLTKT